MLEHETPPLPSRWAFFRLMSQSVAWAALLILAWQGIGVLGYHHFLHLRWVDALVNASMIMSGMGPVDPMETDAAKVFASIYAVLSGVVFLSTFAIVATPPPDQSRQRQKQPRPVVTGQGVAAGWMEGGGGPAAGWWLTLKSARPVRLGRAH